MSVLFPLVNTNNNPSIQSILFTLFTESQFIICPYPLLCISIPNKRIGRATSILLFYIIPIPKELITQVLATSLYFHLQLTMCQLQLPLFFPSSLPLPQQLPLLLHIGKKDSLAQGFKKKRNSIQKGFRGDLARGEQKHVEFNCNSWR